MPGVEVHAQVLERALLEVDFIITVEGKPSRRSSTPVLGR